MKNKTTLLSIIAALLVVALTAMEGSAQTHGKAPKGPQGNDGSRRAVKLLPDLTVSLENQFSSQVIVRVTNKCKGQAQSSYVSMTLPDDSGAKVYIGKEIKALGPGESGAITLYIPESLKPKLKSFDNKWIRVDVDPQNKIKEASEGNNWWEPKAQPFPEKGGYCDPPYND